LKLLAQALGALTSQGVDARLIIAGEGISKSALERELSECAPGRFHFAGHIGSRVELSRLYASADAFVHPNPREPFGLAPLEAMASGLALVAPNQGGVTTYCTSENSWPAEPEAEAFAKAIRAAATDSEERRDRVANALETVKAYAWNSVIDRYFDLYDEIFAMFRNLPLRGIEPSFYSTPGNWLGVEEEPAEIYEPSNSARRS
jgi:glycosyltransferase involved in cell wall biosynthesis